jgi:hypothetical protein
MKPMSPILAMFDQLPQDAIVPDKIAAQLLSISLDTLRDTNPVPQRRITKRRIGRRVGDLRALIRGEACEPLTT